MPEEKDRWGDKVKDAEKSREDQFIAERERALLKKRAEREASHQQTSVHVRSEEPPARARRGWFSRLLGLG